MSAPVLSNSRQVIGFDVGNLPTGVSLVSGGGAAPIVLNRATLDLPVPNRTTPSHMFLGKALGFDRHSNVLGGAPRVQIQFESEIACNVNVAVCMFIQTSYSSDPDEFWSFGAFSADADQITAQALQLRAGLGAGTTDDCVYGSNTFEYMAYRGNQYDYRFLWYWLGDDSTARESFPVAVGTNTLIIETSIGMKGKGNVIQGVSIVVDDGRQDGAAGWMPKVGHTDIALSSVVNIDDAKAVLKAATTAPKKVLFIGSSFTARPDNWAIAARRILEQRCGKGGLGQRLGTAGDSDRGIDIPTAADTSWYTTDSRGFLLTGATGGADADDHLSGGREYVWADAATGSMTFTVPVGVTTARLVYQESVAGSTIGISDGTNSDSADTTGAAGTYGYLEIATEGGRTLTISKATSSGECRVCMLIGTGSRGVSCARLALAGQMKLDRMVTTDAVASWQSFITAAGFDLIIYDVTNNTALNVAGANGLRAINYLHDDGLLTTWTANGAKVVLAELAQYSAKAYSTDVAAGGWITNGCPLPEMMAEFEAAIHDGLIDCGIVSFPRAVGYDNEHETLHNAGGYATQSTPLTSDPRTITDYHPSAAGAEVIGSVISRLLIVGVGATNDSFTPGAALGVGFD